MWSSLIGCLEVLIGCLGDAVGVVLCVAVWCETDSLSFSLSLSRALVTARIKSGQINTSRLNLVEVNNVCDGGLALLASLREIQ